MNLRFRMEPQRAGASPPAKARSSRPQVRSCGLFASSGPNLILHNEFSASAMPPQSAVSARWRPAARASRRSASSVLPAGCVPLLPQAPPEAPARNNRSTARKKNEALQSCRASSIRRTDRSYRLIGRPSLAERTRFELVVRNNPYVGLANRWFQPLTHLSEAPGGAFSAEKVCKYSFFSGETKIIARIFVIFA